MHQRPDRPIAHNTAMIEDFLILRGCLFALIRSLVGFPRT